MVRMGFRFLDFRITRFGLRVKGFRGCGALGLRGLGLGFGFRRNGFMGLRLRGLGVLGLRVGILGFRVWGLQATEAQNSKP